MAIVVSAMTVNRVQFSNCRDQNNNAIVRKKSRALFGAPQQEEIEALIEEQHKIDKARFRINFGIDIDDLQHFLSDSGFIDTINGERNGNKVLDTSAKKS